MRAPHALVALAVVASGCVAAEPARPTPTAVPSPTATASIVSVSLSFAVVGRGASPAAHSSGPAIVVVGSLDEVPLLSNDLAPTYVRDAGALDRVRRADFARERFVAVFAGPQPSGGYSISVREVRADGDTVRLRVDLGRPAPGDSVSLAVDHPFQVLSLAGSLPLRPGMRWRAERGDGTVLVDHVYCGVELQRLDRPQDAAVRDCFLAARRAARTAQFVFVARTSEGDPVPLQVKSTAIGLIEVVRDARGVGSGPRRMFTYACEDAVLRPSETDPRAQYLEFTSCQGDGPSTPGP